MRKTRAFAALSAFLLTFWGETAPGLGTSPPGGPPRLVLFLVIDGMRDDYYERFSDVLEEGGLRKLYGGGTVFENARVEFFFSATAPAHATIATGNWPATHGIVANEWWDREAGKKVESCGDPSTVLLGAPGDTVPGASPHRLAGAHISGFFKKAFGEKAKVFSVSGKSRSAVFLGGKDADGVFWFSEEAGGFTTSSWYATHLPAWVEEFNRERDPARQAGLSWGLLLPEKARGRCSGDSSAWEADYLSLGTVFPHRIGLEAGDDSTLFYEALAMTPLVDELSGAFLERLIERESLGSDAVPDLLLVSLSGTDGAGHIFGPESLEVGDCLWRADRVVSRILGFLAARMDLERDCLIVLTSDHGMAPIPELAREMGHDAGRILIDPLPGGGGEKDIKTAVEEALDNAWGDAGWVLSTVIPCVYLGMDAADSSGHSRGEALRIAREALLGLPGIEEVLTPSLSSPDVPRTGRLGESLAKWYLPERCGELVVLPKPYYVFTSSRYYGKGGTNHGSVYEYDTGIPLVFYGWRARKGVRSEEAGLADIVPTLLRLLGIGRQAGLDGKPLL